MNSGKGRRSESKRSLSFFLGPVVLCVLCGFAVTAFSGCVPYRQGIREGRSPAANKPEFLDPKASRSPSSDAWKGEMEGLASWYGEDFHGRLTASGEVYDMYKMTAAHKTLPLGTVVKVRNLENGKDVEVRINDRGPFVKGRVIDLSRTAGRAIDIRGAGVAKVKLEVKRWPK